MLRPVTFSLLAVVSMLLQLGAAYTPPPVSGDWVIENSDVTSISGRTIDLKGNLTIRTGGKLELVDSVLRMDCASDGQYIIKVESDGELLLDRSTVSSQNPALHYKFEIYGRATVSNSTIEEVWGSPNAGEWIRSGVYICSSNVVFVCSTVRSCKTTGITIYNATPTIKNSTICQNGAWGIRCNGGASPIITGNKIYDDGFGGITCGWNSSGNISGNRIYDHARCGITIYDNSSPKIKDNIIYDIQDPYNLTAGITMWGGNASCPTVETNTISFCGIGVSNDVYTKANVTNNQISNCYVYGISVSSNASPIIFQNWITAGCPIGIYNELWSNASISHNHILNCSLVGINVTDNSTSNITFNQINNSTIGMVNCVNSSASITKNTITKNILGGIQITDEAHPNIAQNNTISHNGQAGVANFLNSSATIDHNDISHNGVYGIYCDDTSHPNITYNNIMNHTYGACNKHNSSPYMKNNTINISETGIRNSWYSNATIRNNTICDNTGWGIVNEEHSYASIEGNDIVRNGIIGIYTEWESHPVIRDNNISNNLETGILNRGRSNVSIISNRIFGHIEGIMNLDGSVSSVEQNEIFHNSLDGIICIDSSISCIIGNGIHDNGNGINAQGNSNVTIKNNTINSSSGCGIRAIDRCRPTIEDNQFRDNNEGISLSSVMGRLSRNTINGGVYGICLFGSDSTVSDSEVAGSSFGILFVNSSGRVENTAIKSIKDAAFECQESSSPYIVNSRIEGKMDYADDFGVFRDSHPIAVNTTEIKTVRTHDTSSLSVRWYVQVHIRDSKGRPLDGADVSFRGDETLSSRTDANGFSSVVVLEEGLYRNDQESIYPSRYSITIDVDGDSYTYGHERFDQNELRSYPFDFRPVINLTPDIELNEDLALSLNLLGRIWDRDNDLEELNMTLANGSKTGANVNITGMWLNFTYSRPIDKDIIYFKVSDGNRSSFASVNVSVHPINDPPVYHGPSEFQLIEDELYTIDLSLYLSDEDDILSNLSVIPESNGNVIVEGLLLTLMYGENETFDEIDLVVIDHNNGRCPIKLTINVTPVDDPPVITVPPIWPIEEEPLVIDFSQYIDDPDTDILNICMSAPSSLYYNYTGLKLRLTYPEDVHADNITIIFTDGKNTVPINLEIHVKQVNDPPKLDNTDLPIKMIAGEDGQFFPLYTFINDSDNPPENVTVFSNSKYVKARGHNLTFSYPVDYPFRTDRIMVRLSDGINATTYTDILVNIKPARDGGNGNNGFPPYLYVLVPLATIGGAAGILAYRRFKYGWFEVSRAFLMYGDGRMLAHSGEKREADDEMLVSSMLTAVQQFIEEAMKKDKAGAIKEFQYEDMKIAVEKGNFVSLAVFLRGYATERLRNEMKGLVGMIEERHGEQLREWDGRMTRAPVIEEAQKELEKLVRKGAPKQAPAKAPEIRR